MAPKPATVTPQKEVIFVPVPVPSYSDDNDNLYRNVGDYNPNPVGARKNNSSSNGAIPLPIPSETEDNDLNYYY